jgi:hypothetical protein
MSRLRVLAALIVLLPLVVGTAEARWQEATPAWELPEARYPNTVFWFDDIEGEVSGWTTVDNTALAVPKFHIDTYYAYDTNSWWCGELNPAFTGGDGYGNSWDQRLNIPAVPFSGGYDVLTFKGRYDSEPGYDYTYVQAKSGGVYIDLNPGYDGSSGGWFDIGAYGFPLVYDQPHEARFRFLSDGAWSDADGDYDTVAGAFHCDDVRIFDFNTGTTLFLDDVESGGDECIPSIPGAAGDWWHVVVDNCSSSTPPHSWWCGDDADTGLIPPNLNNSLITPVVDVSGALTCTLRYHLHAEVPTVDDDGWILDVRFDGGPWISLGAWWGDFGSCDGWGTTGINGHDVTEYLGRATEAQFRVTVTTTDNGCGPGEGGGAGVNLDNTWFEGVHEDAVRDLSWSKIKGLYR